LRDKYTHIEQKQFQTFAFVIENETMDESENIRMFVYIIQGLKPLAGMDFLAVNLAKWYDIKHRYLYHKSFDCVHNM